MICYRDMTFCPFYEDCKQRVQCARPLTPEVIADAVNWWGTADFPVSVFAEKPSCHDPDSAVAE